MCLDLEFNKKTIYFTGDTLTFLAFNLRIGSYIFIVILRYVKQQKREEIIRIINTAKTSEIIKKTWVSLNPEFSSPLKSDIATGHPF